MFWLLGGAGRIREKGEFASRDLNILIRSDCIKAANKQTVWCFCISCMKRLLLTAELGETQLIVVNALAKL